MTTKKYTTGSKIIIICKDSKMVAITDDMKRCEEICKNEDADSALLCTVDKIYSIEDQKETSEKPPGGYRH